MRLVLLIEWLGEESICIKACFLKSTQALELLVAHSVAIFDFCTKLGPARCTYTKACLVRQLRLMPLCEYSSRIWVWSFAFQAILTLCLIILLVWLFVLLMRHTLLWSTSVTHKYSFQSTIFNRILFTILVLIVTILTKITTAAILLLHVELLTYIWPAAFEFQNLLNYLLRLFPLLLN